MSYFYQCLLRHMADGGQTVAWIEERGAYIGALITLEGFEGKWSVEEAYEPPLEEAIMRAKQLLNRNSLPSLAGKD